MAAIGHRRITVGASDVDVPSLAAAAGGRAGTCCDAIRVHGAGSLYLVLEGMAVGATATQHQFYAAGDGLGLRVRKINGTGSSPASSALDVDLYWDEADL